MDILLTHGYFLRDDPVESAVMKPYPPLGLLYLSAYLKLKGFRVSVFDSTFRTKSELEDYLRRHRPPVVGIYGNLITRRSVLELTRLCKALESRVVLGGPEPAGYALEYLRRGADVVVLGEGEETLEELLRLWVASQTAATYPMGPVLGEVRGISFLDEQGQLVTTGPRPRIKELDQLPFPDREAIDLDLYVRTWRRHHGRGAVSIITSRGCPFTCTWCSHGVFGYSYRSRSPQDVADEVESILKRYGPDMLWYGDDVFTINRRWIFSYAEELQKRGIRIPFETISREDRLDEEVVSTLAQMGCFRLWIGSESGSQSVLDAMKRRTDVVRVREMVRLLQSRGIEAGLFIMLGYEGESRDDLQATLDHLKSADPDIYLTTVSYPIQGTPYFDGVSDRIVSPAAWELTTDRELGLIGRHSRRYYHFVERWIRGEVALHKQRQSAQSRPLSALKSFLNAKVGKMGMVLTRHQRESASSPML